MIATKENKYYLVDEKKLLSLLKDCFHLGALEAGGVDNWEWYGESIGNAVKEFNERHDTQYEDVDDIVKDSLKYFNYISTNPDLLN